MGRYVLDFEELDRTAVPRAGGKAANLGELRRLEDIDVPPGFCITTEAFARTVEAMPAVSDLLDRLAATGADDLPDMQVLAGELRRELAAAVVPGDVAAAIEDRLARLDGSPGLAVRSSATAEDLPGASFAGQHDSYLDVPADAVLDHVRRCWASLFTDRAVAYRATRGIDQRAVRMAVVVQQLVAAKVSGVLFTADPVSGDRRVLTIEAVAGLGDALVSGRAEPHRYVLRDDEVVGPADLDGSLLDERQLRRLVAVGRRVAAHQGHPQDIEWCVADGRVAVVQARPITTLYPVPATGDDAFHVFVSVGHQQMMTDAMKPLGLSLWQATTPRPMHVAGGRLFVDVTRELASPTVRAGFVQGFVRSDPLIGTALQAIVDRGEVPEAAPGDAAVVPPPGAGAPAGVPDEPDPALVTELVEAARASLAELERRIAGVAGPGLVDLILADLEELRSNVLGPRNLEAIMASMQAAWWLNEHLAAWLGEKNVADTLSLSVPGNVTAEMGLALLDVADVVRRHPDVVRTLESVGADDDVPAVLDGVEGGAEARDAIEGFLATYGMRGVGEIDVTRPRWRERPAAIVPAILSNVRTAEPGDATTRFEKGRQQAEAKARELLDRVRQLPDGEAKAADTARHIERLRAFAGYREYPKYHLVSRYLVYRQALLAEAERLVAADVLRRPDDIFYLTLEELREVARTGRVDEAMLRGRAADFATFQSMTPPRVMTSHGEVVEGSYQRGDAPAGALVGLAVSAGTVEGRARVVFDLADADLDAGDILVTPFTDPSWTPVFLGIAGLVTEVGGQMTHGAVIAREYGLPAVVGVVDATRRIPNGARIRVHGTDGYVERLD